MAEKTEAQKRAQKSYMSKFIRLEFRATPEQRDTIRAHAAARGESVNAFIGRAIQEAMERDNAAYRATEDGTDTKEEAEE